jgi:hypothetical protein
LRTNTRMGVKEDVRVEVREDVRVGFRKLKIRMVVRDAMERVNKSVRARMQTSDRGRWRVSLEGWVVRGISKLW